MYFLVGRFDVNAMTQLCERYYNVLGAPHKELIWFEKSGHTPMQYEPNKVMDVMVNHVLVQTSHRRVSRRPGKELDDEHSRRTSNKHNHPGGTHSPNDDHLSS